MHTIHSYVHSEQVDTLKIKKQIGKNISKENIIANNALIGIWTDSLNGPNSIEIKSDSIYYAEHFESYKYFLKADSIYIRYPDFTYSAKIYIVIYDVLNNAA